MRIHPIEVSQTASSGAWSFNTLNVKGAELRHICIEAASAGTTFDFSITDEKSNIVYNNTGLTGVLRESVTIPLRGVYTLAVANSSADEAFTGRLTAEE